MRYLLAILLLIAPRAWGAAGDVVSCIVRPDGWSADVAFSGMDTNGTWQFGFRPDNQISHTQKVVLTVYSPGFDSSGASNWNFRIIYGTKQVRFAHPSNTFTCQFLSNPDFTLGNVTNRIALSDYVYVGDVVSNCTIAASLYTKTTGNSANANVPTSNGSTHPYSFPIANWTRRGFRVIETENMDLRAVAFHSGARDGKPVARVEFRVKDSGDNWFTNAQTTMQIDRGTGDVVPVVEYIASFATNTLASGLVTCDVRVYPWIGTTTEIRDSSAWGYSEASPHMVTLTNAVNYSRTRAIVSTNGSDTTGVAATEASWAINSSPQPFLTIGRALQAINNTNGWIYTRSNFGGGIVLVTNGEYAFLGSVLSTTFGPSVEAVIRPMTGTTPAITNFASDATGLDDADLFGVEDISITGTLPSFRRFRQVCLRRCTVKDITANQWFDAGTTVANSMVIEQCTLTNLTFQGLQGHATDTSFIALLRGSTVQKGCGPLTYFTAVGNHHTTTDPEFFVVRDARSSMGAPRNFPAILAYNKMMNLSNSVLEVGLLFDITNSSAIVQNVFEMADGAPQGGYTITSTLNATNVLLWNNSFPGAYSRMAYNDTGANPVWKVGWDVRNNIFEPCASKSDTWTTANGARTGNWAVVFGSLNSGNGIALPNSFTSFPFEFAGIGTFQDITTSPQNYIQFVTHGGYDGTVTNASPGDFRLLSQSPSLTRSITSWLIPFDIEGIHRGGFDPPGAYASASPRKGGAFFGQ